jgi:hypothetical protein
MKSLTTLIKLQKTYVDEQRIHLATLQERLESIIRQIAAHQIEMAREQVAAENNEEARTTYGAYLEAAVIKAKILEKDREAAAIAVDIARAKLAELFEEQKRYEIAQQAREAAELAEEQKRERMTLDEVSSVQYTRKKDKR